MAYRTHLAVGFLIGVGFMMTNLVLLTSVASGSNWANWNLGATPQAVEAVEAFSILLVLTYVRAVWSSCWVE